MARAATRTGCRTSCESPQGSWVHTTVFQVPAHTRLNVTIINYDSGSPLRNQQLGQVTGTTGRVALLNGKRFRVINSNAGNGVGHTFSIPSIGINMPLYGNNGNANLCGAAPCTVQLTSPGDQVLLHHARAGQLPLAVLRPLRARLPVRQRWAHVDAGVHGRLHAGGDMSDTQSAESPCREWAGAA